MDAEQEAEVVQALPDATEVEQIGNIAENDDRKFRLITVENLRHPGGWFTNRQFQRLLNKAATFQTSFERPERSDERQIKTGSIEFVFSTVESARDAYTSLQKMIIDGARPITLVDPEFFAAEISSSSHQQFFEVSDDGRLVYLLDAPKSIDEHMIAHFFGSEVPVHFSSLPMPSGDGLLQVEVLLESPESAQRVLAGPDKFPMSDEDVECVVTLLKPREYALYSRMDDARQKPSGLRNQPKEAAPAHSLAPEIDEDEIVQKLMDVIDERRLNFAEINEKDEIYELCDAVSALYNGVPDSILKPAMGAVLQKHLNRTEMHWMREHIESLLRTWKTEILREQPYPRPSFVAMEAPVYQPVIREERKESKGANKRSKAARAQMGVGAFLSAHRERLLVETGEVDVDSDDDGNVVIGGEALSFDSWARITKTKASGVVRTDDDGTTKIGNGGLTKKQQRLARTVEGMDQDEWKRWRKEKSAARKAEMKQRIMAKGAMEEGGEEDPEAEKPLEVVPPPPVPPPVKKDLDEGEIDSEEERKAEAEARGKKRKAQKGSSDSSSDSTSSSSEEETDGPVDARKRRKLRRKKDRKNPRVLAASQPTLPAEFKVIYENRKALVAQMTPAHKAAFASALTQIIQQQNNPISQANASQLITSAMSQFK
ncbi:unnamed protein product [Caenorhabditis sp. 36 PRJEB53466]|nr:unnamed protein product [Caenorhabditis sp. 36 PRJEB53466]